MKRMLRTWRSATALLLAVSMFFGMSGITYAANTAEKDSDAAQVKKYVALGDSMTNGYGLSGYEIADTTSEGIDYYNVNGFLRLVKESYPNVVAQYFNGEEGKAYGANGVQKWNIAAGIEENAGAQLATSAMRVEDLRFLLEYGTEDAYEGDAYTQKEFVNRRFNDYVDEDMPQDQQKTAWSGTENRANIYQNQIKEADVISLGIGNANFGVFLLGCITNALGVLDEADPEVETWQVYDALEELELSALTEERKALIKTYYDMLTDRLNEEVEARVPGLGEASEAIVEAIAYTFVSFAINYNEVLTDIVSLNDKDAEIILVGLMNTMSGFEVEYDGKIIPVDKIADVAIDVANLYLAALPTLHQVGEKNDYIGGDYASHDIYFAETNEVEILMYDFQKAKDANWVGYETLRSRLIESVCEMIFALLKDPVNGALANVTVDSIQITGLELVDITLADVTAYEDEEKYEELSPSKRLSCAFYLAFENAVVNACDDEPLQASAFAKLFTGYEEVLTGLMGSIGMNKLQIPEDAIDKVSAEIMENEKTTIEDKINTWLATDDGKKALCELYTEGTPSADSTDDNSQVITTVPENWVENNIDKIFAKYIETTDGEKYYNELLAKYVPDYASKVVSDQIGGLLEEPLQDETLQSLFNLYARMLVGNGIGCHPSAEGHKAIAQSIIDAYVNGNTVEKETIDTIKNALEKVEALLEKYGPTILEKAYDWAEEEGIIDFLREVKAELVELKAELIAFADKAIAEIEAELAELKAELKELKEQLKYATGELKAELEAKIEEIEAKIAALEAKLAELVQIVEETIAAIEELNDAVEYLIDVIQGKAEGTVKDAVEQIAEAYEKVMTALDKVKDFVDDVCRVLEEVEGLSEGIKVLLEEVKDILLKHLECCLGEEEIAKIEAILAEVEAAIEKAIKLVGAIDAAIEEAFAEIEEKVNKVVDILKSICEDIKATKEQVEEYLAKLEAFVEELKDEVDYLVGTVIPAVKAEIKELEAKLAELKEELINASGELKEEIEAAIAEIEKQLAALEAKLAEIEAMIEDIIEAIEVIEEAIAEIVDIIENAEDVDWEAVLEAVQEVVGKVVENIDDLEALVESIVNTIEDAKEIAEAVVDALAALEKELKAALAVAPEEVKAALEAALETVEAALAEADAIISELVDGTVDSIKAKVKEVVDKANEIYQGSMSAEYEISEDNYYVAMGDVVASDYMWDEPYASLVADELEAEYGYTGEFVNLAEKGMSVTGLLAALEDEATAAEIEKADLITVGFSVNGLVETALTTEDVDWSVYFGDAAVEIEALIEEAKAVLAESGLPSDAVSAFTAVVEALPYTLVEYVVNYYKVAAEIHAINEEALVILVGMYNPLEGAVLNMDGEEFAIGEYFEALIDMSNVHLTACALLSDNTIFVEAKEVETWMEQETDTAAGMDFLFELLDGESDMLHPSDLGHDYIKEQILGALTIKTPEAWTGLLGDVNLDGVVDTTDAQAIFNHFMGIVNNPEMIEVRNADLNQDGYIDTSDAQAAFNIFMGIE